MRYGAPRSTNMEKLEFDEAVSKLTNEGSPYHSEAYIFLRDALDQTVKFRKRQLGEGGHVTGPQLCEGIRQHALKLFGPMVTTVFEYWGIGKTDDFGERVYQLIGLEVFGKTEGDKQSDFNGVYKFHDAFVAPFQTQQPPVPGVKPPASVRG